MRASNFFLIPTLVSTLAISAAPLLAQETAQEFQLPPAPSPSAAPQVEGPVDDSGIVPVAPRRVNTPASSPLTPTPTASTPVSVLTPTPTPTQTGSAPRGIVQPIPSDAGLARETASTTQVRTPAPVRQPTETRETAVSASPTAEATVENETQQDGNTSAIPSSTVTPDTPAATADSTDNSSTQLPDYWPWWAAGIAAAILALLAGWFYRRRSVQPHAGPALAAAPETTPETLDGPSDAADEAAPLAAKPDLAIALEVEKLTRSMMTMTLRCRVTLVNRSDRAARDVTVCADLVSANRALPMESQIAGATAFLPEIGTATRIGPHKTQPISSALELPIAQLSIFKHGNRPMAVPLVRIRLDCKDGEPEFRTFVVGIAADPSLTSSSKLHPIPLDGIPGSYENIRSRPIANPASQ